MIVRTAAETFFRHRRLRRTQSLRDLAGETRLSRRDLVYPIFVTEGRERRPIGPMPGCDQVPVAEIAAEARRVAALGVPGVLLFGIPALKDDVGSGAYHADGVVQEAVRAIKSAAPDLSVITDVCLCEYTDHGHCGLVTDGRVDNDATLELLARTAVSHAAAGADVVAPSAMMDGQVGALRRALDDEGYAETPIMAYAAKYASAFYGPFRAAAESAPQFGDRHDYQMDPGNARMALREMEEDVRQGADILMVKPALAYLDVILRARDRFDLPLAAYNVSGEYSMVMAAGQAGWLDQRRAILEVLTAIKRAGADIIITYHALDVARWLAEGE